MRDRDQDRASGSTRQAACQKQRLTHIPRVSPVMKSKTERQGALLAAAAAQREALRKAMGGVEPQAVFLAECFENKSLKRKALKVDAL